MDPIKSTIKSTWTPLGEPKANLAMFEERRNLVTKWFSKWTNEQRKQVLSDLVRLCSSAQLLHVQEQAKQRRPIHHEDFTRVLPRYLCHVIMSYLDPRSLCRAAQVSWHWNWLCDSDEVWLPKCARLGWFLPAQADRDLENFAFWTGKAVSPGVYKRLYLENLTSLQVEGPTLKEAERLREMARRREQQKAKKLKAKKEAEASRRSHSAAWRAPDRRPVDTVRLNYLDNKDVDMMERRRRAAQPHNTMRSVVQLGAGRVKSGDDSGRARRHAAAVKIVHEKLLAESMTQTDFDAAERAKTLETVEFQQQQQRPQPKERQIGDRFEDIKTRPWTPTDQQSDA